MAPLTKSKQNKVTYDAGPLLIEVLKSIEAGSSNDHVDEQASQVESALAQNGIARRGWVRDMLYQYRGIEYGVESDYDLFIANIGVAKSAGALGPKAGSAIRAMADRHRKVKPQPKPQPKRSEPAPDEEREDMFMVARRTKLEGAFRAIERAPGESTARAQYEDIRASFNGTEAGQYLYNTLLNFSKVCVGDPPQAWSWFAPNFATTKRFIGAASYKALYAHAKKIWDDHDIAVVQPMITTEGPLKIIAPRMVGRTPTPQRRTEDKEATEEKKVETPELDTWIESIDRLSKLPLPEAVKSTLESVKASLELARTSKKQGSVANYTQHVLELVSSLFTTIAEIVKHAGQDPELAMQAAEQLGKIAKWTGRAAKVLNVIDDLRKIIWGKDKGERIEAAIDLITVVGGTVGFAVALSLAEFKWIWNTIGVPTHDLIKEIGLTRLFGSRGPDGVIAEIRGLPASDPQKARWVRIKIYDGIFKATSGIKPGEVYNLKDHWHRFLIENLSSADSGELRQLNEADQRQTKPGENPIIDDLRVLWAQRYQSIAIRFVESVKAEAEGWK